MKITGYRASDNSQLETFSGDIKAIQIFSKTCKFIPGNLGSISNLVALRIQDSQLLKIKSQDFYNMQNLKHLSLWANELTSLRSDVFSTLIKLKEIYLGDNQIEEIPFDLFSNNVELEIINLTNNKIKYLGSGLLDGLVKLNKVYLSENFCVTKDYIGNTAIQQLKQDMKLNCISPNDLKFNQMVDQLLNSKGEQQKCQVESDMLRIKLSEANKNENELKKVKAELLETIELKVPKMRKQIKELKNELFQINYELFELKQERLMEQILFRELKSKLKEANENLANRSIL
ncbi:unnamed protein product [Diamesa hyperborea]